VTGDWFFMRALPVEEGTVTTAELRVLAREYATIVRPGEVLIVRVPSSWRPREVAQLNEALGYAGGGLGISVLVVPGDGVSVATPPADPFAGEALPGG
jgi:hypothetical protein